jgi:hypothetical protein
VVQLFNHALSPPSVINTDSSYSVYAAHADKNFWDERVTATLGNPLTEYSQFLNAWSARVRSTEAREECIGALGSATSSKEELIPIGKWTCTVLPYRLY